MARLSLLAALVLVASGAAVLVLAASASASVATYRAAPECPPGAASAKPDCLVVEHGTITQSTVDHGKTGDTTDLDIALPAGTLSTWVSTSFAAEDALHVGAPVTVELYHGQITRVTLPGFNFLARDNPIREQNDLRLTGLLMTGAGGAWFMVQLVSVVRRRTPPGFIDSTADVAELRRELAARFALPDPLAPVAAASVSVMLPYTVRPQPAPTPVRAWWLGPIALVVGFPSVALRMRSPATVTAITLVVCILAAAFWVVVHWLYIHRRQIVVDDMNVTRVDLWGRRRSLGRSEIRRAGRPVVHSLAANVVAEPRLVLLGDDGRCVLALPRYYLSQAQASELAAAISVSLDPALMRLMSPKQMQREFPGSVSWFEQHPVLLSVVLTPIILAILGFFVWAISGFK